VRAGERHPPARPEGVATSSMPMDASARSITGPFSWLLSRLCRSFGSIAVSALSYFQLYRGFSSVLVSARFQPCPPPATPYPNPGPGKPGTPEADRARPLAPPLLTAAASSRALASGLESRGRIALRGISLRWDRPAWDRPSSDLPSNPTPHPVIAPRSRPRGSPPVSDRRRVVARSARIGNRPRPVVRFRRRLPTVATCHRPRSRASRR